MQLRSNYDIPYGHKEELLMSEISGMASSRPKLEKEKCSECGTCYLYCPTGAVSFDSSGIHFVFEFCKGCGICEHECPSKAILMMEINRD